MVVKMSAFLSEAENNGLSKGAKYCIKVKDTFVLFTVGKNYTFQHFKDSYLSQNATLVTCFI